MKVFTEFAQYSDEWFRVRRGKPTASEFGSILTPKTGKLSASADGYICKLISEIFDIEYPRKDTVATAAMRRGSELEPKARQYYEMVRNIDVKQVGFVMSDCGRFGMSPDGLCGDEGLLELKCPMPENHVKWLIEGIVPYDYLPQIHGQLLVSGLKWVDFLSYCPGFPPLLIRTEPNDYTQLLKNALEPFYEKFQEYLKKVRDMIPQE